MFDAVKLVSLNIEGDKHWATVLPFLAAEQPEVVCLQEVYERDLVQFSAYPYQHFLPNTRRPYRLDEGGEPHAFGCAVVSRLPFVSARAEYYWKPHNELPLFINGNSHDKRGTFWQGYIAVDIQKSGAVYRILTTHFTWTPTGEADDNQHTDMAALRTLLAKEGEHVLCGDFNIPRGVSALSALLVDGYTDCISPLYTSSLDPVLHRANKNPEEAARIAGYMVDYLLTTPRYVAHATRMVCGVSDHCAIVATLGTNKN